MKKLKIYRIEHCKTGLGIFYALYKYFESPSNLEYVSNHNCSFPNPEDDNIIINKDHKIWFYAYKTRSQINDWINNEELLLLLNKGFIILELTVVNYQQGSEQIAYTKNSIVKSKNITMEYTTPKQNDEDPLDKYILYVCLTVGIIAILLKMFNFI